MKRFKDLFISIKQLNGYPSRQGEFVRGLDSSAIGCLASHVKDINIQSNSPKDTARKKTAKPPEGAPDVRARKINRRFFLYQNEA